MEVKVFALTQTNWEARRELSEKCRVQRQKHVGGSCNHEGGCMCSPDKVYRERREG